MKSIGKAAASMILFVTGVGSMILAGSPGVPSSPLPQAAAGQSSAAPDLAVILAKTAEYCRKLESVAFDFICREEISEKIDPNLEVSRPLVPNWTYTRVYVGGRVPDFKNTYVYDYQCVRADRTIREVRTLLEENRKKKNESNAPLKTAVFVFGNVIQGPIGLFGEQIQGFYEYKISGSDKIGGRKVILVDSLPRLNDPDAKNLFGKAWIDAETFDILKIEWSEKRVGNYDIFRKRAEKFNRKPRLTLRSEFSVEKNGIRFPSKLSIEEAYLNERGRAFVRSETTVIYKDFKFFTVEVEVK
jgi:hypothetical protein